MKKGIWMVGSIVIALVLMGASFYGGTLYQKNQQTSAQARFLASRGLSGNFSGGAAGTPGATTGRGFGGGTQGQVKSINGNTISLSTAQNVTTVTLSRFDDYLEIRSRHPCRP